MKALGGRAEPSEKQNLFTGNERKYSQLYFTSDSMLNI